MFDVKTSPVVQRDCSKLTASHNSHFMPHSRKVTAVQSGFGGLELACWPLVPKFACSNPAEAVGFLRATKSARLPSEGK